MLLLILTPAAGQEIDTSAHGTPSQVDTLTDHEPPPPVDTAAAPAGIRPGIAVSVFEHQFYRNEGPLSGFGVTAEASVLGWLPHLAPFIRGISASGDDHFMMEFDAGVRAYNYFYAFAGTCTFHEVTGGHGIRSESYQPQRAFLFGAGLQFYYVYAEIARYNWTGPEYYQYNDGVNDVYVHYTERNSIALRFGLTIGIH